MSAKSDPPPSRLAQILKRLDNDWGYAHSFVRSDVERELAALLGEIAELREFVDRCHELGATDTDIVKHALEDQARIREELAPLSIAKDAADQQIATLTEELDRWRPRVSTETGGTQ